MKSTTFNTISERQVDVLDTSKVDRKKAWPFLILLMSTGLPVNYALEVARPMTVADVAELTAAATATGSSASSMLFVMFLSTLYCMAGWMLLKKPKAVAAVLSRQWPLALLMVFVALSMFWTSVPSKVTTNIIHNFGTAMIALAAAIRYRSDPWLFPKQVGYVLGFNMLLQVAAVFIIPAYAVDWQDRWRGFTTHPNTLGAMAFTTLWANAAMLICTRTSKKYLHFLFAAVAAAAVIGADSVTSMMAASCSVLLLFVFKRLEKMGAGRQFYLSLLVIIAFLSTIIYIIGNVIDFGQLLQVFGRDAQLTGRRDLWDEAFKALQAHPLLGWSFDDHAKLIAAGMPYPTYHNGFIDLSVSGGISCILLFFSMIGVWAVSFMKKSLVASQIGPYSAAFIIAYLIHNLTEASLVAPRGQMWQVFLVVMFLGACKKWEAQRHVPEWHGEYRLGPALASALNFR